MDYYQVLGLQRGASSDEIKQAYRKLSMKFHPDKNDGDKYFENWSKKINEAYGVLGDPEKRAKYDSDSGSNSSSSDNQNSNRNSNSHSNSNSQKKSQPDNEALSYLRKIQPEYARVKTSYIKAQNNYSYAVNKKPPNEFTASRVFIGFIGILIGAIIIKKSFNESIGQATTIAAEQAGSNNANDANTKVSYQNDNPSLEEEYEDEIEIPQEAEAIQEVYIVRAAKANFFNSPVKYLSNNKYVIENDQISATMKYGDFVYTEFTNRDGVTTKGWLNLSKLSKYEYIAEPEEVNTGHDAVLIEQKDTTIAEPKKKKKGFFRKVFGGKKNKEQD